MCSFQSVRWFHISWKYNWAKQIEKYRNREQKKNCAQSIPFLSFVFVKNRHSHVYMTMTKHKLSIARLFDAIRRNILSSNVTNLENSRTKYKRKRNIRSFFESLKSYCISIYQSTNRWSVRMFVFVYMKSPIDDSICRIAINQSHKKQ